MKRYLMCAVVLSGLSLSVGGCGVKGDPIPPVTPAEIGHGKPLYKTEDETTPLTKPRRTTEQKNGQDSQDDQ